MRRNNIILFDLGDTLFYRDKPIKDFDIDLISNLSKIDLHTIDNAILETEKRYQGIYKHWFDNDKCSNLENEYKYVRSFFSNLFEVLGVDDQVDNFLDKRKNEIRYKLFSETTNYLQKFSQEYTLGIVTNGRPSRRNIIKQLDIEKFFDKNLIFISDEIGYSKPSKEFFDFVLDKTDKATEVILCDDEDRNINYAKSIDWKVFKIEHKSLGFSVLDVL